MGNEIINPRFCKKILREGTVIETLWHLNRFPGKYSVEYQGKYYTVYLNSAGHEKSYEHGADNTPVLAEYEDAKKQMTHEKEEN